MPKKNRRPKKATTGAAMGLGAMGVSSVAYFIHASAVWLVILAIACLITVLLALRVVYLIVCDSTKTENLKSLLGVFVPGEKASAAKPGRPAPRAPRQRRRRGR